MIANTQKINPDAYPFPKESYDHQEQAFHGTCEREYYAFFWEMGCGKSKPILETAIKLFLTCEIDGLLIISDKGCYNGWELDHIPTFMPKDLPHRIITYSSSMNREGRQGIEVIMAAKDDLLDILVMNVESLSGDRPVSLAKQFLDGHHAMMVVDESTSIKNLTAKRTKNVITLGQLAEYRRIATGTPVTQSPLDLFAQCEFLKPGSIGFKSFVAFRSFFAIQELVRIGGNRPFMQVRGYRNLDILTRTISTFSSRLLKDECLDLPEKVYETVYVEQTPEQEEAYTKIRDEAVYLMSSGHQVTTTMALTTLVKLHQINCGHLKDDEGHTHDIPSNRVNALLEVLEKIPGKVVIWGSFQRDVELIKLALPNTGKEYAVDYYGKTPQEQRKINLYNFAHDQACRWFVGTAAAGGKGINDLVVAHTMIYFSNTYSLEDRLQSEDRLHRPGQEEKVTIIDMVVPRTIDSKIVKALRDKHDVAKEVLDSGRLLALLGIGE